MVLITFGPKMGKSNKADHDVADRSMFPDGERHPSITEFQKKIIEALFLVKKNVDKNLGFFYQKPIFVSPSIQIK